MKRTRRIIVANMAEFDSPACKQALFLCDEVKGAMLGYSKPLTEISTDELVEQSKRSSMAHVYLSMHGMMSEIELSGTDEARLEAASRRWLQSLPRHVLDRPEFSQISQDLVVRRMAALIEQRHRPGAVVLPVVGNANSFEESPTQESPRLAECLQVAIDQFPIPGSEVPFDVFLQFLREEETLKKRDAFIHWLNKAIRSGISGPEVGDELAAIVSDYTDYMRAQRLKFGTSRVDVLVRLPAEIIEHLIKLKFGSLVGSLLQFRKKALQLTESELSAPHREIAYVVHARERLRKMGKA